MTDQDDTSQKTYQKWYSKHKGDLAKKRKDRYANDPEYRAKCLENARKMKEKRKLPPAKPGWVMRLVEGKATEVCPLTTVATLAGVSAETIRRHERKGMIPETTIPGKQRVYTENQVKLLVEYFSTTPEGDGWLEQAAAKVRSNWDA